MLENADFPCGVFPIKKFCVTSLISDEDEGETNVMEDEDENENLNMRLVGFFLCTSKYLPKSLSSQHTVLLGHV